MTIINNQGKFSKKKSDNNKLMVLNIRRESSIKRKNVHQQNLLDSTNYKEFMFKGVLVVKNKYGEEIDSIDIIPDQIEIVETQDEHYLKHVIEDIGYVVLPSDGDHQNPKTISFFYYLRRHNELRFLTFFFFLLF